MPEVDLFQAKISRTREIHQYLYYAVEAVDFAADDVDVPAGVRVDLLELALQQLQMQYDGVNGVLDFMRNAASKASAGGKAPRHFDFVFNLMNRLGITDGKQRAYRTALLLDEI